MVYFAISKPLSSGDLSPDLLLVSITLDAIHMVGQISREEKGVTHLVHNDHPTTKPRRGQSIRGRKVVGRRIVFREISFGCYSHLKNRSETLVQIITSRIITITGSRTLWIGKPSEAAFISLMPCVSGSISAAF